MALIDLTGLCFGKLVVLEYAGIKNKKSAWLCQCCCGTQKIIIGRDLRSGKTKGCGLCRHEDLVGIVFGKLTVVSYSHADNGAVWNCLCLCGNTCKVRAGNLKSRYTSSCGCSWHGIHNLSQHPLHSMWEDMKKRCYNKNRKDYKNYGARGIIICAHWKDEFKNFYDDMINIYNSFIQSFPTKIASIERIDVNGNYEPSNCLIIDKCLQGRNRRVNKLNQQKVDEIKIKYVNGKSFDDLAIEYNTCKSTIQKIISGILWS